MFSVFCFLFSFVVQFFVILLFFFPFCFCSCFVLLFPVVDFLLSLVFLLSVSLFGSVLFIFFVFNIKIISGNR